MTSITGFLRRSLRLIGQVEMALAAIILCAIVLMILMQVLLNAGLGNPITWEQEAGAYALVWLTFLGASIGLKQMRHVTISSFIGRLPLRLRYLVRAFVFVAIIWTLLVILRELPPIMRIEGRSDTVALPISLPRSYFFSLPLMLASGLMVLTSVLYLLEALIGALRGGDETPASIRPVME
ncbi:TRAP transporter small permease subunit [Rhodophyticola sp. CCM32]|uniref:TRAP transporter small permease n=1 Tax=Rhodophyticola sp. CCM32 TaxID=2916397 RepID=UPI00107F1320|nr:TRAP transporter small permease subunit [Rhodophyticola sp. CCM32]QBX99885.1 TRAP transporter small permease subunit [Rhodophyticola sp. CCM32]